jgi:hypothetical protein
MSWRNEPSAERASNTRDRFSMKREILKLLIPITILAQPNRQEQRAEKAAPAPFI